MKKQRASLTAAWAALAVGLVSTGFYYMIGQVSHIDCGDSCAADIPTYAHIHQYSTILLVLWLVIGGVCIALANRRKRDYTQEHPEEVAAEQQVQAAGGWGAVPKIAGVVHILAGLAVCAIGVLALAFGVFYLILVGFWLLIDAFLLLREVPWLRTYVYISRAVLFVAIIYLFVVDANWAIQQIWLVGPLVIVNAVLVVRAATGRKELGEAV